MYVNHRVVLLLLWFVCRFSVLVSVHGSNRAVISLQVLETSRYRVGVAEFFITVLKKFYIGVHLTRPSPPLA
jgi:hypothetical protein